MALLVWTGTAIALLGLAGLVACVVLAWRVRRAGLTDAALRARLRRLVALNLGALMLSAFGLVIVVTGVMLV